MSNIAQAIGFAARSRAEQPDRVEPIVTGKRVDETRQP